jgi:hypothetical protein
LGRGVGRGNLRIQEHTASQHIPNKSPFVVLFCKVSDEPSTHFQNYW